MRAAAGVQAMRKERCGGSGDKEEGGREEGWEEGGGGKEERTGVGGATSVAVARLRRRPSE